MSNRYQATLDFLYEQLPMFSRVGSAAYKKDLTNTIVLSEFWENPHLQFKSIHIGGTNGKGSTTNYLASMCIEAGLKVGIYTSPHLVDFRERIKIGNQMIPQEFVIDFVEKSKPIIEEIKPSFFELTVVMAFRYFAEQKADIAIIEVGLGGRLDSTNIITPELSVITNVSFDHTNMLGNSIKEIAFEKAGIIKNHIPCIIGEYHSNYSDVFEKKTKEAESELVYADKVSCLDIKDHQAIFSTIHHSLVMDTSVLEPLYQIKNIKTSIVAFEAIVKNMNLQISDIAACMSRGILNRTVNTGFLGRWTKFEYRGRNFILESAHNEAGIEELNRNLTSMNFSNITIVFGCVRDKDISKVVSLLPTNHNYILTQANIPRALNIEELKPIFQQNNLKVAASFSISSDAISYAITNSESNETILITGSIFLVGEVLGDIFVHSLR